MLGKVSLNPKGGTIALVGSTRSQPDSFSGFACPAAVHVHFYFIQVEQWVAFNFYCVQIVSEQCLSAIHQYRCPK